MSTTPNLEQQQRIGALAVAHKLLKGRNPFRRAESSDLMALSNYILNGLEFGEEETDGTHISGTQDVP